MSEFKLSLSVKFPSQMTDSLFQFLSAECDSYYSDGLVECVFEERSFSLYDRGHNPLLQMLKKYQIPFDTISSILPNSVNPIPLTIQEVITRHRFKRSAGSSVPVEREYMFHKIYGKQIPAPTNPKGTSDKLDSCIGKVKPESLLRLAIYSADVDMVKSIISDHPKVLKGSQAGLCHVFDAVADSLAQTSVDRNSAKITEVFKQLIKGGASMRDIVTAGRIEAGDTFSYQAPVLLAFVFDRTNPDLFNKPSPKVRSFLRKISPLVKGAMDQDDISKAVRSMSARNLRHVPEVFNKFDLMIEGKDVIDLYDREPSIRDEKGWIELYARARADMLSSKALSLAPVGRPSSQLSL